MNRYRWWLGGALLVPVAIIGVIGSAGRLSAAQETEPLRLAQGAPVKPASPAGVANSVSPSAAVAVPGNPPAGAGPVPAPPGSDAGQFGYSYDPSGRRDPFATIFLQGEHPGEENLNLPPLQRVGVTELSLMGIVWGGFGYNAMVQTPDGKGYTVRTGTRVGPNNGVVTAITENSVIVQERFTDVYGKHQVREYIKRLHEKESSE